MRYARFMEKHVVPVNFRDLRYDNVIQHLDYREQVEHAGRGALKSEWQTIQMFLRAYGIDPRSWFYRPPSQPLYTARTIPFPDDVHRLIHLSFSGDGYENALIRSILTHSFVIGWRFPSEPSVARVSDVDLRHNLLRVTSPKLHFATRIIDISEIATRKNVYSLANYLRWRDKVKNSSSGDSLYLTKQGRPFKNGDCLRMYMHRHVIPWIKTVYKEFYNYGMRHWSAVAHLIRTKIQTGHYDVYEVCDYMGHRKIETTKGYLHDAQLYYKQAGYDWIQRVLKHPRKMVGENPLKNEQPCFRGVQYRFTPVGLLRRLPDSNLFLGGKNKRKPWFYRGSIKTGRCFQSFIKPFLFSFQSFLSSWGHKFLSKKFTSYPFLVSPFNGVWPHLSLSGVAG